jgi:hypothetical protein
MKRSKVATRRKTPRPGERGRHARKTGTDPTGTIGTITKETGEGNEIGEGIERVAMTEGGTMMVTEAIRGVECLLRTWVLLHTQDPEAGMVTECHLRWVSLIVEVLASDLIPWTCRLEDVEVGRLEVDLGQMVRRWTSVTTGIIMAHLGRHLLADLEDLFVVMFLGTDQDWTEIAMVQDRKDPDPIVMDRDLIVTVIATVKDWRGLEVIVTVQDWIDLIVTAQDRIDLSVMVPDQIVTEITMVQGLIEHGLTATVQQGLIDLIAAMLVIAMLVTGLKGLGPIVMAQDRIIELTVMVQGPTEHQDHQDRIDLTVVMEVASLVNLTIIEGVVRTTANIAATETRIDDA